MTIHQLPAHHLHAKTERWVVQAVEQPSGFIGLDEAELPQFREEFLLPRAHKVEIARCNGSSGKELDSCASHQDGSRQATRLDSLDCSRDQVEGLTELRSD